MKWLVVACLFCASAASIWMAIKTSTTPQASTAQDVTPRSPLPKSSTSTTTTYQCEGGKGFKAQYRDDESLIAIFGSKQVELQSTPLDSGETSYSDGVLTITKKGDKTFVDIGKKRFLSDCVVTNKT